MELFKITRAFRIYILTETTNFGFNGYCSDRIFDLMAIVLIELGKVCLQLRTRVGQVLFTFHFQHLNVVESCNALKPGLGHTNAHYIDICALNSAMEVLGNAGNGGKAKGYHRPSSLQLMGVAAKHRVLQMSDSIAKGLCFINLFC